LLTLVHLAAHWCTKDCQRGVECRNTYSKTTPDSGNFPTMQRHGIVISVAAKLSGNVVALTPTASCKAPKSNVHT
jgi:hypothetical protein